MSELRIVGIDPGQSGALCLLSGDGIDVRDMPVIGKSVDGWALSRLFADWGRVDRVVVEFVAARPGQSAPAMWRFGVGYGIVVGVLEAMERPMDFVTPTEWTKYHRVGSDKAVHRRRACELWPASAEYFARAKDEGRADAALIAAWARDRFSAMTQAAAS